MLVARQMRKQMKLEGLLMYISKTVFASVFPGVSVLFRSCIICTHVCVSACVRTRARKRMVHCQSLSEVKSRENRKYSSRRAKLRSR